MLHQRVENVLGLLDFPLTRLQLGIIFNLYLIIRR